jgi:two-component system cell cycle sensor histidine kinase/response regulator CckA
MQHMLERLGYEVTSTRNGAEAIAIFKQQPADLVITDIRMPGTGGMEVLKHIKAINPLTPVIILTGYGSLDVAIQALKDYDAFDFLTKPKGVVELQTAVQKALEHGDLLRQTERLQKEIQEQNLFLTRQNEELRRIQEALEKSHRRYQDLYHNAPVGYLTLDENEHIVDANQTLAKMFGTQKESLTNRPFDSLIDPDDIETYRDCKKAVGSDEIHVCEMKLKKEQGPVFYARLEAKSVADPETPKNQTRVIITEISTQKEIQRQMIESRKLEAIATLAGGVAHQYNNALAGLTGYLELIQFEFKQNKIQSPHLPYAFQLIRRMADLTQQLLAYASGGKYAPNNISLAQFIGDMLSLMQHGISKEIRVETEIADDLNLIRADSTQLQMVLLALVQNSAEAMQTPGRITIGARNVTLTVQDIRSTTRRRPGNFVCLWVTDEGCGMDAATVEKIFDPFFTTKFIGRGLGLSAVYGIISNHNGWIEVDSTPGQGTKVSIYLPVIAPQVSQPMAKKEIEGDQDGHEATVLVIEDDITLRKVTRQLLGRMNYRILEAETGQAAKEIVASHPGSIDAVILDMLLPDTDGVHLYHELRALRSNLRIILCSGYAMGQRVKDLIEAGAQSFLPKPYSTKTLATELKKIIEKTV